jgi:phospholipase C
VFSTLLLGRHWQQRSPFAARPATTRTAAAPIGSRINRIVIIYQENHSFDNVYGG